MNTTNNRKRAFRLPSNRWLLLTALSLLLVILLNLLIALLPTGLTRFDMTATKLTDLSDMSVEYLKSLKDEVTLHYICITGNEDEGVLTLLDRYDERSDKLTVKKVDPAVHPSFVAGYTDRELSDNSIIVESAKRRKVLDYTDLLIYTVYATDDGSQYTPIGEMLHADFTTFYQTYADYFSYGTYSYEVQFAGENAITSAIDYVVGETLPKVYTVTGHGESALSSVLLSYLSLDNIDTADLALPAAETLPDDADCLILNAPQQDITETEAALLRAYLVGGGNIMLLTDSNATELPVLMALMKEFGMEASSGILKEGRSDRYYSLPYFLLPNTAGAQELYGLTAYTLLMPYAHPIAMTECDYTMTYTSLFSTSDRTILEPIADGETDPENELTNENADDSESDGEAEPSSYDVGALVKLQTEAGSGKLCWLSSSMLLVSDYNNAVSGGNYTYFLAILESMCEKSGSLAIASKTMTEPSLVLSNGQIGFWAFVIIGLIPVSLAIIGIVIRERRRRR